MYKFRSLIIAILVCGLYGVLLATVPWNGSLEVKGNLIVDGTCTGCSSGLVLIQDQVVGSAVPTVTFSSIPGTYKHLKLIINARSSTAATSDSGYIQVNADTGANYSVQTVSASGSGAGGFQQLSNAKASLINYPSASTPANEFGYQELTFFDYAGTTANKLAGGPAGGVFGGSASNLFAISGTWKWASTAAITQIVLGLNGAGNFVTGSRFTLYGMS